MKPYNFFLFINLCCLGIIPLCQGQTILEKRVEEAYNVDFFKIVYPVNENGVLYRTWDKKSTKGSKILTYTWYNQNLEKLNQNRMELDKNLYLDVLAHNKMWFCELFTDKKNRYAFIALKLTDQKTTRFNGALPPEAVILDMVILEDKAYFSGRVEDIPYFFTIDLKTGSKELIPMRFDERDGDASWGEIEVNEEKKEIFIYVKRAGQLSSNFEIYRLDSNGNLLTSFQIKGEKEHPLLDLTLTPLKEDSKYFLTGTYYNGKMPIQPTGIVCGMIANGKLESIQYHGFMKFENFLSLLPNMDKKWQETRQKRKERMGKELEINYDVVSHKILERDGKFIYIGEGYHPT